MRFQSVLATCALALVDVASSMHVSDIHTMASDDGDKKCDTFCVENEHPWHEKCAWSSGKCAACAACSVKECRYGVNKTLGQDTLSHLFNWLKATDEDWNLDPIFGPNVSEITKTNLMFSTSDHEYIFENYPYCEAVSQGTVSYPTDDTIEFHVSSANYDQVKRARAEVAQVNMMDANQTLATMVSGSFRIVNFTGPQNQGSKLVFFQLFRSEEAGATSRVGKPFMELVWSADGSYNSRGDASCTQKNPGLRMEKNIATDAGLVEQQSYLTECTTALAAPIQNDVHFNVAFTNTSVVINVEVYHPSSGEYASYSFDTALPAAIMTDEMTADRYFFKMGNYLQYTEDLDDKKGPGFSTVRFSKLRVQGNPDYVAPYKYWTAQYDKYKSWLCYGMARGHFVTDIDCTGAASPYQE